MRQPATALAARLGRDAEAVCRHYLSNGRREGRYWLVGDLQNTPGRSLYVRLLPSPSRHAAAGKWTDAATGEHGDLLDLIAAREGLTTLRATLDEARRFLGQPRPDPDDGRLNTTASGSSEAAQRLFAMARPLAGTVAERYLCARRIVDLTGITALRFHARCRYRPVADDAPDTPNAWPALIAAVTAGDGTITGVQRAWLDPDNADKAPIAAPRKALGLLLGNGVRFGVARDLAAAGEGIETMLSLRQVAVDLPVIAALSANNLAALDLPKGLRRLYIARDDDAAGRRGVGTLATRARAAGIEVLTLDPMLGDFNDDLRRRGAGALAAHIATQIAADDRERLHISA